MKRVCVLAVIVAALLWPPDVFAQSGERPQGPIMRAALASLGASQATPAPPPAGKSRSDWFRVMRLRPGSEIMVTMIGSPVMMTRRLLHVEQDALVVLDATSPSLPVQARKALVKAGSDHPSELLAVHRGADVQLQRHVRISPAGVFFDEDRVESLDAVLKTLARPQVVELRVRRKHVGTHSRRGFFIGAGIGTLIGAVMAGSCGPDREEGYCDMAPMMTAGALSGGVLGLEIGTMIGILEPRTPDVIYRAD